MLSCCDCRSVLNQVRGAPPDLSELNFTDAHDGDGSSAGKSASNDSGSGAGDDGARGDGARDDDHDDHDDENAEGGSSPFAPWSKRNLRMQASPLMGDHVELTKVKNKQRMLGGGAGGVDEGEGGGGAEGAVGKDASDGAAPPGVLSPTLAHLDEVELGLREMFRKRSESMDTITSWSTEQGSFTPGARRMSSADSMESEDDASWALDSRGGAFSDMNRDRTESSELWYSRQTAELREATLQLARMEEALRAAELRQSKRVFKHGRTGGRIVELKASAASLRMELIKWRQDLKCGGTPYEIRATMDEARSSQTEMQQRQQQKEFAQQWIDLRYPLGKELKPSASLSGSRL